MAAMHGYYAKSFDARMQKKDAQFALFSPNLIVIWINHTRAPHPFLLPINYDTFTFSVSIEWGRNAHFVPLEHVNNYAWTLFIG